MSIGDNIKHIREEKGLTQQQLATLIGMHRSNYSKIESGQRDISIAAIIKIANHFNITVDELVNNNSLAVKSDNAIISKLNLIQELDENDKIIIHKLIDLFLTNKKFKDFLKKNIAEM